MKRSYMNIERLGQLADACKGTGLTVSRHNGRNCMLSHKGKGLVVAPIPQLVMYLAGWNDRSDVAAAGETKPCPKS